MLKFYKCVLCLKVQKFILNNSLKNIGVKESSMHLSQGSALANHVAKEIDSSLTWKDITWLKTITKMPIVIKGIITGKFDALCS